METQLTEQDLMRELRTVELFAHLPEEQLAWIASVGEVREVPDGTVLVEDGTVTTHLYVLLAGELMVTKRIDGHDVVFTRHVAPPPPEPEGGKPRAAHQFTGDLQLLTDGINMAAVTVVGGARVLALTKDAFFELMARCPSVARVLLPVLAWRIRESEVRARSQVTATALENLAAGLAHELNNPAAAVARIATDLMPVLERLTDTAYRWAESARPQDRAALAEVLTELNHAGPTDRDQFEVGELEDALEQWTCDRSTSDITLAAELADLGIGPDWLEDRLGAIAPDALPAALDHLCVRLEAKELVEQLCAAAPRISTLVDAVRSYAHLDRAPEQDLDVIEGLEATLAVQAPRLLGVHIERRYAADVPRVWGFPSELNQVWTELISSAVETVGFSGTLTLRVDHEDDWVTVEIGTTGTGILPDLTARVTESTFRVAQIGDGAELGMHLAHQIVTRRHGGTISVESTPDDTRVSVRLPIRFHRPGAPWAPPVRDRLHPLPDQEESDMPGKTDAVQAVWERQIKALSTGDLDELMKNYHSDAVLVRFDKVEKGFEEIRKGFQEYLTLNPEVLELKDLVQTEDTIFYRATMRLGGQEELTVGTLFVRDGKVWRQTAGMGLLA